jgi:hypothetical protein
LRHAASRGAEENRMDDQATFDKINALASEEEDLWRRAAQGDGLEGPQAERLDRIRVELDQCYDLLHQRQARRAAGLNPEGARVRSAEVVEHYEQ